MSTVTIDRPKTSSRKRTSKTSRTSTLSKQKLTLYVTAEGAKRLGVHATMLGTDRSALIERLIADHLKRFVVSDRERSDDELNRPADDAQASLSGGQED
jgi:hypothetical protein